MMPVNAFSSTPVRALPPARRLGGPMARDVIAPRFGALLKDSRLDRGLTMGQVVARVHQTGRAFEGFTQAQLSRYEAGQVQFPDPAVLWRLCRLYGNVEVANLIEVLADERGAWAEKKEESPP